VDVGDFLQYFILFYFYFIFLEGYTNEGNTSFAMRNGNDHYYYYYYYYFTSTSLIKPFPAFYGIFVLNPQATSNGYPYYHSTGAA
jgi:hypothetical protein